MKRLLSLAVAGIMFASSGCGSGEESPPTYSTPQAAYDAFSSAAEQGDWKGAAMTLTPEAQDAMCVILLIPAGMMAAFDEEAGKELEAIMEKHGLSDDAMAPSAESLPVKDKPAFIGDVASWLTKQGSETADMGMPEGDLADVQIDGDTATANIDGEPIAFRKINGSWLIHLDGLNDMQPDMGEGPGGGAMDVEISSEPLQGVINGEPWQVGSVKPGAFGGVTLASSAAQGDSDFATTPEIMLGESWEPMEAGSGELGFPRNITFFVPPGNNIMCVSGKYEVQDAGDNWILRLYAYEDEDYNVNGQVTIPKNLDDQ